MEIHNSIGKHVDNNFAAARTPKTHETKQATITLPQQGHPTHTKRSKSRQTQPQPTTRSHHKPSEATTQYTRRAKQLDNQSHIKPTQLAHTKPNIPKHTIQTTSNDPTAQTHANEHANALISVARLPPPPYPSPLHIRPCSISISASIFAPHHDTTQG